MNIYSQLQETACEELFVSSNARQVISPISLNIWMLNLNQAIIQSYISQFCLWNNICSEDHFDIYSAKIFKLGIKHKRKADRFLMLKRANLDKNANKLLTILTMIDSESSVLISGKRKAESKEGPISDTRSTYIGVSRNGLNWQALISINKRKTYIGSYTSEISAAVAFDFHSILLHFLTAKTNFSYTKEDLISMIINYKENNNSFKVDEFVLCNNMSPQ